MDSGSEQDLVRRAQGGDTEAFEELVRGTARLVWAHVHGLVRDSAWTEDLVQETYLRAWEAIAELQSPGAFRGWLLTIARRLAWRHAEVASRSTALPEEPPAAPAPSADPEEAREQVQAALARLPERYRLPVTLHYLNGMDYQAIARSLDIGSGSLRGLLARGAKKLRAELAPWWRVRHGSA